MVVEKYMMKYLKQKEPYYLLFTAGVISSVLGVSVWINFNFFGGGSYPREGHAALMFFGFLGAFVAGFLMTAVPKMTGTAPADQTELGTILSTSFLINLFALANKAEIAAWIYLFELILLVIFVGRRFLKIRRFPFSGMVFIPIALVGAIISILLYIFGYVTSLSTLMKYSGEVLILNLICGLGVRLVPMISRFPHAVSPDQSSVKISYVRVLARALLLNALFWADSIFGLKEINFALAAFLLFYFARYFGLFKRPGLGSRLGWGLKIGEISLILGYALLGFDVFPIVAAKHLIFIGGFTLITMLISTRVILAHGGKNLDFELKSPWILPTAFGMILLSVMRVEAGVNVMGALMRTIPFLFLVGMLTWYIRLLRAK